LILNNTNASHAITFICTLFSIVSSAQLNYTLNYKDSASARIKIPIQPPATLTTSLSVVMTRSVPGGYQIYLYDSYIEYLYTISSQGEKFSKIKDEIDAPR
jgi:hypothetical protein